MLALLLMAVALLLAGCARAPRTLPPPTSPASGLAAPVLAPMAARDRLLKDLDVQKEQARERAATFDEAAGRDR